MIFNENGNIMNGNYILEQWYSEAGDTVLDELLNESISDMVRGAKKTVQTILRKMIDLIQSAIEKISRIPHRKIINFLKQYEGLESLPFELSVTNEDQKILNGAGYQSGKLLSNFQNACEALKNNHSLSLNEIKEILYQGNDNKIYDKESWFGK